MGKRIEFILNLNAKANKYRKLGLIDNPFQPFAPTGIQKLAKGLAKNEAKQIMLDIGINPFAIEKILKICKSGKEYDIILTESKELMYRER